MVDQRRWRIIGKSVLGASHSRLGLPNQDFIDWKQPTDRGVPLVLAVADGHGSEKYFRSDVGARFAVQVAIEVMTRFEKGLSGTSLSMIEDETKRLPLQIVTQWKKLVESHWAETQPNEREWKWLRKKENADAWKAITENPTIPYGATLLTVLLAEGFMLYLQLGDGDILTVASDGSIDQPVPGDERNLANETTSLCEPKAQQDFRMHFQRLDTKKPALVMLSTDGYSNSFLKREGFYKVGSDIWQMIYSGREAGLRTVEDSLEGWLNKASETGSGDDITVGLLCRMSALDEEGPIVEKSPQPARTGLELPGKALTQRGQDLSEIPTVVNPGAAPPQQRPQPPLQDEIPVVSQKQSGMASQQMPPALPSAGGAFPAVKPVDISSLETVLSPPTRPSVREDASMPQGSPAVVSPPRQVLIVSKHRVEGPHYTSIDEAIKAARPRDQIRVLPGQYHENVVITKSIEIIGQGPPQEIVIESNTPCIQVRTDHAVIRGMTIRGKRTLAGLLRAQSEAAIDILQGQLVLRDCFITSESSKCFHVHGPGANLNIIDCYISRGERRSR